MGAFQFSHNDIVHKPMFKAYSHNRGVGSSRLSFVHSVE